LNHCVLLDNPKIIERLGLLSQPLFWLKVAIFNPVAEAYEYYFLGDLGVLSVIFLVNPSIICYNCD
ncbi:hypothetical protein, partial [Streptococcus parasanguinis]|uniref:hypothetical protein n=1 Tax=Streptococcus parasanguinis TaxID=1318 RepID=UPI00321A9405